jgi:signal transduction histidine kinase
MLDLGAWRFHPYALLPLVAFGASLVMAVLIWSQRPEKEARRATYAPISVSVGMWSLCVAVLMCMEQDRGALAIGRLAVSFVLCTGPLTVSFGAMLARSPRRSWWVLLAWLVALVATGLTWLDPLAVVGVRTAPWGGRSIVGGPHFAVPVLLVVLLVLIAAGIVGAAWWKTPPSRYRRQLAYVFFSYITGLLGGLDSLGVSGYDVPPVAWLTGLAANGLIYYAIVKWRLMDIRTVFHRALFWTVAALSMIAPLYGIVLWTEEWRGWQEPIARIAAVVAIVALFRVYAARAEIVLRELLFRQQPRHAAVLAHFVARTMHVLRPDELLPPLREALEEGAGLELAAVILSVESGEGQRSCHVLPGTLPSAERGPELPLPEEPVTRAELDPRALGQALGAEGVDGAPLHADREVARWLAAYRADGLIPMRHVTGDAGLILVRIVPPLRGVWSEPLRQMLARLGARAAVAFTNASLYEELGRQSAGLETTVKQRTESLAHALEDLKRSQASLVQAGKQSSLGLLVAGVSHEINNALNIIYGNLPSLSGYNATYEELFLRAARVGVTLDDGLGKRCERVKSTLEPTLAILGDAANRARHIVVDLRRFARRDENEEKVANLCEGLDATLNLLGAVLKERIIAHRHFAADVPPIRCYPAAMNHVFLNVLLNAAQAIEGVGTITIDVRVVGPSLVVAISDTGRGVPEADRERVFAPFFTTRRRAAGLGLAVSREIVTKHGGTICLAPNPEGRGTRVTLELPVKREAQAS